MPEEIFNTWLSTIKALGATYAFKILWAIVILIVGIKLTKFAIKIINKTRFHKSLDESVQRFLNSFIKIALYLITIITAAIQLGIPATSFVTVLASCGLAIGLALQGSLSNFAGGLMILIFKPFKIGDYIITSTSHEGTVKDINILYTILLTPDNRTVTIPNGTLSNGPVVDVTGNETRRLDVEIGISYDSDAEKALELLSQIASETPQVLPEPEIQTAITAYADSSVNLVLRVWVKTPDYWTAKFFINRRLRQLFSENNIEIPYPQMDVHIKNK